MSLIHCKKVYGEGYSEQELRSFSKLPLRILRTMPELTICEGFVTEANKMLNPSKKATEFICFHCGRRFYYSTLMYMKVLDALGVDYSWRLP